ncbi:tetraspanin-12-like [Lucilia cuprina]|uniref:tetraspanin-12-like n=1 Tax=Lucilia cuprina TaxID=7375 RepID=UPI001F065B8C|nr:tetraspanin-12-like [Lucilia cuprina]
MEKCCFKTLLLKPNYKHKSLSFEISKIIYEKGCVQAGEEWMERNLIIISTSAIITIFFQILFIIFTQNLRAEINAQKSKWH